MRKWSPTTSVSNFPLLYALKLRVRTRANEVEYEYDLFDIILRYIGRALQTTFTVRVVFAVSDHYWKSDFGAHSNLSSKYDAYVSQPVN